MKSSTDLSGLLEMRLKSSPSCSRYRPKYRAQLIHLFTVESESLGHSANQCGPRCVDGFLVQILEKYLELLHLFAVEGSHKHRPGPFGDRIEVLSERFKVYVTLCHPHFDCGVESLAD